MRRRTWVIATVAWVIALGVTASSVTTGKPAEIPVPPVVQQVVEGFGYMVGASPTLPDPARGVDYGCTTTPEACKKITDAAMAAVIWPIVSTITRFFTPAG